MFIQITRVVLLLCALLSFVKSNGAEAADNSAARAADAAESVKQGRQLFGQAQYAEALRAFERALDKAPANKETRFLAALSAYWARKPERALEYWNQLHDLAARGGNDEWEVVKNRVLTLNAMGKFDAAEMAITRLGEIRTGGKSSTARVARGFLREHIFGKNMRAGCWEAFDERGDAPALWTITVTQEVEAASNTARPATPAAGTPNPANASNTAKRPVVDKKIAMLAVEVAVLPGGGAGYVFSEETDDARRIYKRWSARPDYSEVRPLVLSVLQGTATPLEEKAIKPVPADALPKDETHIVPFEIHSMGLDAQTETIVYIAWKLRLVKSNVTDLVRLEDPAAFDDYLRDFNTNYPSAAADASELTELIKEAKAENLLKACDKIMQLTFRSSYLEFALLTAFNTRNRDIPEEPLRAFLKSSDFMVRQTSALLLARHGKKDGVAFLFKELESADARGCALLMGAMEELLGHVFDAPPNSRGTDAVEKLKAWKADVEKWRASTIEKLTFNRNAKAGEASWSVPVP